MVRPRDYSFHEFHPNNERTPSPNAKKKDPHVTLQRWRGVLHLNLRTYELLGEPEAVVLAFDKRRIAVGLRAASLDEPHAIKVRSTKTAGVNQSHKVTIFDFAKRHASYGIDLTRTWVFPCIYKRGWIIFELAAGLPRN